MLFRSNPGESMAEDFGSIEDAAPRLRFLATRMATGTTTTTITTTMAVTMAGGTRTPEILGRQKVIITEETGDRAELVST